MEAMLLARILAYLSAEAEEKIMETGFVGNRKVALILSWPRGEYSKLMPQQLCPPR